MTESKVALADLDDALQELADARMAYYEDDVLFVRARVKRLRQKTVQIAKSIVKDIGLIAPGHPLRTAFLAEYSDTPWLREALLTLTSPSGDPHGSLNYQDKSQIEGPSSEGHPTLKGKGKGKGKGIKNTREHGWTDWAERNLPDLPASFVSSAASMLDIAGQPVTVESVLGRLQATYPHVLNGAAA